MNGESIYKITNLCFAWLGIIFIMLGLQRMNDSGYTPPEMPSGYAIGLMWITSAICIAVIWSCFVFSDMVDQKVNNKSRFTTSKLLAVTFVLIFAGIAAVVGTYLAWKHPFRLGPCDCDQQHWGASCKPCLCVHGVCDFGQYGSGRCSCDFGFAGDYCDKCDARHKPEPIDGAPGCDLCKTGYVGPVLVNDRPKCDECDIGYTGAECDICDSGWQPWFKSSDLFPNTIAEDDDRHICDECLPNHWGFYCQECPWGNDVPQITVAKNNPIINGTRVQHENKAGIIMDMQVLQFVPNAKTYNPTAPGQTRQKQWVQTYTYLPNDPKVLEHTQVKIVYDGQRLLSKWIPLSDIRGVQCNNRGICNDDQRHQDKFPEWKQTCTFEPTFQECTTDKDCKVSENCKGVCQGIDLPLNSIWEATVAGMLCKTDADCYRPQTETVNGEPLVIQNYEGGRCVTRGCCKESWHGSGKCDCESGFFGPLENDGFEEHYEKSPACDFCPGYDWLTENPVTICSGGQGTCSASYSRDNDYLQMRCTCGTEVYVDPNTGNVDSSKIISWSGDLCECGDWDEDSKCDICAAGHWGETCDICPGGAFSPCGGLGKGQCNSGREGDGTCNCKLSLETSWMLAPYVRRYPSEPVGKDIGGNSDTCSECAPNFFGDRCLRCDDTDLIKSSELNDIFQPGGSYELGEQQSSSEPRPVCHRGYCTLACGGGGWCNWGREGDGRCTCWSNKRLNSHTWNPLDNVCIGNNNEIESCPAYGYCSEGPTGRRGADMCGKQSFTGQNKSMLDPGIAWTPYDDWSGSDTDRIGSTTYDQECSDQTKGQCYKWLPIDWRPSNLLITCVKENN